MYKKTEDLIGFKLSARDGEIGRVRDFYFDDRHWAIRHIVAETGNWLPRQQVLLSPIAILGILDSERTVKVDLTKQQIERAPSVEVDRPVSRQMEEEYYRYYGWPSYWQGPYVWGLNPFPRPYAPSLNKPPREILKSPPGDPHLRSAKAVKSYRIQALDDEFGHVEGLLFDEQDWVIRYLIVDTRNWWPGKKVLVSPDWLSAIDWSRSNIRVSLDRETIKRSPEFDPDQPITHEYEDQLHAFYILVKKWLRD